MLLNGQHRKAALGAEKHRSEGENMDGNTGNTTDSNGDGHRERELRNTVNIAGNELDL